MTHKGFTLIELMVVVIIIGLLGAIALPKMIGMSNKAKVAELGPAVGTWSKLQQAYFNETSLLGNWNTIGYQAPGTYIEALNRYESSNFFYQDPDFGTDSHQVNPSIAHWQATSKSLYQECNQKTWKIEFVAAPIVTQNPCPEITPIFERIQ